MCLSVSLLVTLALPWLASWRTYFNILITSLNICLENIYMCAFFKQSIIYKNYILRLRERINRRIEKYRINHLLAEFNRIAVDRSYTSDNKSVDQWGQNQPIDGNQIGNPVAAVLDFRHTYAELLRLPRFITVARFQFVRLTDLSDFPTRINLNFWRWTYDFFLKGSTLRYTYQVCIISACFCQFLLLRLSILFSFIYLSFQYYNFSNRRYIFK